MTNTKGMKQIFLSLIVLFLLLGTGITWSYFTDEDALVNTVTTGQSDITIVEKFPEPPENPLPGTEVTKEVSVRNNQSESWIRMMVKVNDSRIREKISLDFNTADWTQEDDSYWYYKEPVKTGETTEPLLRSVTFEEYLDKEENLEIICYGESVNVRESDQGETAYIEAFKRIQ